MIVITTSAQLKEMLTSIKSSPSGSLVKDLLEPLLLFRYELQDPPSELLLLVLPSLPES